MAISTVLKKAILHVVQANSYPSKEHGVYIASEEGGFAIVLSCTGP